MSTRGMVLLARLRPTSLSSADGVENFYRVVRDAIAVESVVEDLTLDMSWVSFIPPEGIIALITAARLWHTTTGSGVILTNMRHDVHQYLDRMDLFNKGLSWLRDDEPLADDERFDRSPATAKLLELLPLAGEEDQNARDVAAALTRAERIVETWFDAGATAVGRLLTVLSEIGSNVVHSRDHGFAVMQRYRDPAAGLGASRVTTAVGDLGIGIEASLRSRSRRGVEAGPAHLVAGSDYIQYALTLGVTSRTGVGGLGLYQVRSLVDEWQGELLIRSWRSWVRISPAGVECRDDLVEIPGVQVVVTVRGAAEVVW